DAGTDGVHVLAALERDPSVAVAAAALASSPLFPDDERDWRNLVLLAALERHVFRLPGSTDVAVRVRVHSTAVAFASAAIAPFASVDAGRAFAVGLFHDAGLLLSRASHERAGAEIASLW